MIHQELAKEIVLSKNKKAVKELIENLFNKKAIQNDCVKVFYEVGEQELNSLLIMSMNL